MAKDYKQELKDILGHKGCNPEEYHFFRDSKKEVLDVVKTMVEDKGAIFAAEAERLLCPPIYDRFLAGKIVKHVKANPMDIKTLTLDEAIAQIYGFDADSVKIHNPVPRKTSNREVFQVSRTCQVIYQSKEGLEKFLEREVTSTKKVVTHKVTIRKQEF